MLHSDHDIPPHFTHSPLHKLESHLAAVKAVSWCPWQRGVLASGGGTHDRTIKVGTQPHNGALSFVLHTHTHSHTHTHTHTPIHRSGQPAQAV
ncbi:hypothetical protein EON63_06400 [archaeon]|nr:MAG: hypothetical protein EON63_06400 [archaeon]